MQSTEISPKKSGAKVIVAPVVQIDTGSNYKKMLRCTRTRINASKEKV